MNRAKWTGGVAQVVEHLLYKHEAPLKKERKTNKAGNSATPATVRQNVNRIIVKISNKQFGLDSSGPKTQVVMQGIVPLYYLLQDSSILLS
jgi:hypothetical protein